MFDVLSETEIFVVYLGLLKVKNGCTDELDAIRFSEEAQLPGLTPEELTKRKKAAESVITRMKEAGLV